MNFYERIKQKFVYIYLFALARRFYRFLKNFPNVGYDILERGYRYATKCVAYLLVFMEYLSESLEYMLFYVIIK